MHAFVKKRKKYKKREREKKNNEISHMLPNSFKLFNICLPCLSSNSLPKNYSSLPFSLNNFLTRFFDHINCFEIFYFSFLTNLNLIQTSLRSKFIWKLEKKRITSSPIEIKTRSSNKIIISNERNSSKSRSESFFKRSISVNSFSQWHGLPITGHRPRVIPPFRDFSLNSRIGQENSFQ